MTHFKYIFLTSILCIYIQYRLVAPKPSTLTTAIDEGGGGWPQISLYAIGKTSWTEHPYKSKTYEETSTIKCSYDYIIKYVF